MYRCLVLAGWRTLNANIRSGYYTKDHLDDANSPAELLSDVVERLVNDQKATVRWHVPLESDRVLAIIEWIDSESIS